MKNYTVKPMSNIAQVGLDEIKGTSCNVHEDSESPDGVLVRSTKLSKEVINDNLKELCPLVDVRYSNVSPTTKPAKGKQDRQQIINRIFMRYNRVKNKK